MRVWENVAIFRNLDTTILSINFSPFFKCHIIFGRLKKMFECMSVCDNISAHSSMGVWGNE